MSVVKLEALNALEAAIVCAVPELKGNICVGQAAPGHKLSFPSMAIIPVRWRYEPNQEQEHVQVNDTTAVVRVGAWRATVQFRLGHKTSIQRAALEDEITSLFLSSEMRPGILLTRVVSAPCLGRFTAAWELDSTEWDDEAAFDQQFYSVMAVDGVLPALATMRGRPTIRNLELGLAFTPVSPTSSTFNTDPRIDVVRVNADGTITPA